MTTNSYFTSHNRGDAAEQDLYESMVIENIQFSGQDYIYIPRTLSGRYDQLFGEDVLSSFDSYATIEMWLENYSGYGGEAEMLAKFGMESRNTATFLMSRKRFKEEVVPIVPATRNEKIKIRPCEGDLVYAPFSQSLFEIKFVEDEYPGFYQIKKKYVWALRCELVQLNNEKFSTGNKEVDETFGININRLDNTLRLQNGFGIMMEDGGSTLLEIYQVSKQYDDLIGFGDNDIIKNEFSAIVDFNEDNPFGESF